MSVTEIVLLIVGVIFFAISFFLPDGKEDKEDRYEEEAKVKALIDKEVASAKEKIEDIVDETVTYSVEKTERALERMTNEKIMAVSEYSDTVIEKINNNHNEAVFLYDLLNDKDEKIKNTGDELKLRDEELKARDEQLRLRSEELKRRDEQIKAEEERKAREEERRIKEEEQRALNEEFALSIKKMLEESEANKQKEEFQPLSPDKIIVTESNVVDSSSQIPKELMDLDPKMQAMLEDPNTSISDVLNDVRKNSQQAQEAAEKPASKSKSAKAAGKSPSKTTKSKAKEEATIDEDDEDFDFHFHGVEDVKKNKNDEIRRLHAEGKSNMAIAKELGLGVGEVKLVLDLFSTRK